MPTFDSASRPVVAVPADVDFGPWLADLGTAFAVFDLQDSGCVSYGVDAAEERLFVKRSTTAAATQSLQRALVFHQHVRHDSVVAPMAARAFPDSSLALIYPWQAGQVLYPTTTIGSAIRTAVGGPMTAFRALPVDRILAALDTVIDVHLAVVAAGFVAVDLYDGCLMYDAEDHQMRLVDLDEYRPGPFTVTGDRLPGSTRFMAPEESRRGTVIDERTTVYNIGRTIRLLLDGGDAEQDWRGTSGQLDVAAAATDPEPHHRYSTVSDLHRAWADASAPVSP